MTSRDFCYWLQGLLEVANPDTLSKQQIQVIQNHLNMVFHHEIDPSFGGPDEQEALDQIHTPYEPIYPRVNSSGIRMKC